MKVEGFIFVGGLEGGVWIRGFLSAVGAWCQSECSQKSLAMRE